MPLTATQTTALTTAIRETAAAEILPRFRNLAASDIDTKSSATDLVTIADRAAERAMTERFQAILPGDTVIGEEAISEGTASLDGIASGRCVVIDPIDGTWNYAHGNANYGVLVAVIEDGETVWGCCYDPSFDDWVSASKGCGAWFHQGDTSRRLHTRQDAGPLSEMRGNIGEMYMPQNRRDAVARIIPQLQRHTSLGASVMEYRQMALGGSDFCLNAHLNVWDHGAGALCLSEAGGVNRLLDGRDYTPDMTVKGVGEGCYLLNARSDAVWEAVAEKLTAALDEH